MPASASRGAYSPGFSPSLCLNLFPEGRQTVASFATRVDGRAARVARTTRGGAQKHAPGRAIKTPRTYRVATQSHRRGHEKQGLVACDREFVSVATHRTTHYRRAQPKGAAQLSAGACEPGRFARSRQGSNACVRRVAMDGYPGLARSKDCVAQWLHGGPADNLPGHLFWEILLLQKRLVARVPFELVKH